MFTATFSADMSGWLPDQVLNLLGDGKEEEKMAFESQSITVTVPRPPRSSRRPPPLKKGAKSRQVAKKNEDKVLEGGGSSAFERHRSLSPVASPSVPRSRKMAPRSLSQDSPLPSTSATKSNRRSQLHRPTPVKTKMNHAASNMMMGGHHPCSVDPIPSPKFNGLATAAHLSEEAPMSPKVNCSPLSPLQRQPSLLGRMIRSRKKTSPLGIKPGGFTGLLIKNNHSNQVNQKVGEELETKPTTAMAGSSVAVPGSMALAIENRRAQKGRHSSSSKIESELEVDLAELKWDYSSRPEILKHELETASMLDKRHASRSVRCVVWKPKAKPSLSAFEPKRSLKQRRNSNSNIFLMDEDEVDSDESEGLSGGREKFALKMIMRRKNIKMNLNEKNIMLAMNSAWHTKLINTFKTDNNLYMLLEYSEKGSIGSQIIRGRGLKHSTSQLITFYTACLVLALEYMHEFGIVHRDIKPDNLLIGNDGYLKVCDYGLSKFLPIGEKTRTFLGTLAYMPPEQLSASYYDHSVDYWGLAVSMYEMNYGYTPFEPHDMLSATEWKQALKTNIKKGTIHFPTKNVGLPMKLLMKSMLVPTLTLRLGSDLQVRTLKEHSCFSKIDWFALKHRTLQPPSPPMDAYSFLGTML